MRVTKLHLQVPMRSPLSLADVGSQPGEIFPLHQAAARREALQIQDRPVQHPEDSM